MKHSKSILILMVSAFYWHNSQASEEGWTAQSLPPVSFDSTSIYLNGVAEEKENALFTGSPNVPPLVGGAAKATITDPTDNLFNDALSVDITELVRGLQNDPLRIFDYVRNHIAYDPYFGSMKGATMALRDQSANDMDQSSLLIALLEASGYSAEYVYGTMTIPMSGGVNNRDMMSLLGIEATTDLSANLNRVRDVLSNGGIPMVNFDPNTEPEFAVECPNSICPITIARVWVRANINGNTVDLDPAFKPNERQSSELNIAAESGFDKAILLQSASATVTTSQDNYQSISNLSRSGLESKLSEYTMNLIASVRETYFSDSPEQVLGLYQTAKEDIAVLPADVGFSHTEIETWSEIPAQFLHTMRLEVGGIRETVSTKSLYGKKLGIHFENGSVVQKPSSTATCSSYSLAQTTNVNVGTLHQSGRRMLSYPLCADINGGPVTYVVSLQDSGNGSFELLNSQGQAQSSITLSTGGNSEVRFDVRFKGHDENQFALLSTGIKQGLIKIKIDGGSALFDPATGRKEAFIDLSGVINQEPSAVITLDDEPILGDDVPTYTNSVDVEPGTGNLSSTRDRILMTVDHPYAAQGGNAADESGRYALQSLGDYVIGLSFGDITRSRQASLRRANLQRLASENSTATDQEVLRESLYVMGLSWLDQTARIDRILLSTAGHRSQSHHRFGMLGQVDGYFIDFRNQFVSLSNRKAGEPFSESVFRANSFLSSALEHGVLEQLQGANRKIASTISAITDAVDNDQAINYYETLEEDAQEQLVQNGDYSTEFVAARANELGTAVFDVLILPQQRSQINEWVGEAFVSARSIASPDGGRILMGISGDSIDGTLGGGFPTTEGPVDTGFISADSVLEFAESSLSFSTSTISCGPVNYNTGDKLEAMTDLGAGAILFSRYYNSANYLQDNGVGLGWRHSLDVSISEHSDELSVLGERAVSDMTPILLAQQAVLELLGGSNNIVAPTSEEWVVAALVANWAVAQLQDNAVTTRTAQAAQTFIRLPDGSYNPPPQNTSVLASNNDRYTITGRFGSVTSFNSDNRLESLADIDGNAINFTYIADKLDRVSDTDGNFVQFIYIGDQLERVQDHTAREVSFDYEGALLRYVSDVENKQWEYQYNGDQRLFRRINPLQETIKEMSYDSLGRVATQTWPRSAGNAIEAYLYGEYATTVVDPLLHSNITKFDGRGRTQQAINALDEGTEAIYDGQSRVVLAKDSLGRETLIEFDKNNNRKSQTNTAFETTMFDYDSQLRLEYTTDPNSNQFRTQYDPEHHPTVLSVYPESGETISVTSTYLPNGNVHTVIDAKGAVTTNSYDSKRNPDTQSTSYDDGSIILTTPNIDWDYDDLGRLMKLTDQEQAETIFTYDNRNNVTTITDPTLKLTTLAYDDVGRLESLTDRNNVTTSIDYTISGQIEKMDFPGTLEDVDFTYDLRDQVKTMTDSIGVSTFDYDALGRLGDATDGNGFTVGYRYNNVGLLEKLIYPDGKEVLYTYDAANRLKTLENWLDETVTYFYDLTGRLDFVENANGTITEYEFDGANRLKRLTNKKSSGEVITEQVYTLDNSGNPTSEFRIQPQAPQEIANEFSFDYNAERTRLESIVDENSGSTIVDFVYDNEGQQTEKGADIRVFDARHRLTQQGGKTYAYDGNNNRLKVTENAATRYFIYDAANNLLAEATSTDPSDIVRYYIHGQGLNQMIQGANSYSYHYNLQGHTLAMTDDQEVVQNQYAYSPFGRILGDTETSGLEQPFKYVGKNGIQHEQDEIYYVRARYYDSETGRFLKEDPIGVVGGLNVSLYAGGNPVALIDSSGNAAFCIAQPHLCAGAAIGAISGAIDFGFQLYDVRGDFTEVDYGSVAEATISGFVSGVAGSGLSAGLRQIGTSGGLGFTAEVVGNGFIGGLIGAGQGVINGEFSPQETSLNILNGSISGSVGGALTIGAGAGTIGRIVTGLGRYGPDVISTGLGYSIPTVEAGGQCLGY